MQPSHLLLLAALLAPAQGATQPEATPEPEPSASAYEAEADAVAAELQRGVSELRLDGAAQPYRAEARYVRARLLSMDASFGGVITDVVETQSAGIAELRVGSPGRDNANFFGGEGGLVRVGVPLEPAPRYLRRKLWLALDGAFRGATQSFAQKEIALEQLAGDEIPADFTAAPEPVRAHVEPNWAPLPREELAALAGVMSGEFAKFPSIDNGDVYIQLLQSHETVVSTDGLNVARMRDRIVIAVVADTKAEDGMHLDHARAIHLQGVPALDDAFEAKATALVTQVLTELDSQAKAPMIEEEYDGPILFRGEAAGQLLASTVATEAAGTPAPLADGGRLMDLEPTWQRRYGKNVMPPFVDLIDDPTGPGFGSFDLDMEGVKPAPLSFVRKGILEHLLMTRTPNGKVTGSNGRARMSPSLEVGATISNLSLVASERRLSANALERELLRRAREDGYEYAYVIERLRDGSLLGPVPRDSAAAYAGTGKVTLPLPVRVFRIEPGGKKTLIRGVVLGPASMRVLRRIRAVGNAPTTVPMRLPVGPYGGFGADIGIDSVLSQTVDVQVTTPDLLIDGLELLVERGEHERMPTLEHPLRRETPEAEPRD
ncbi:MAG: metallopeptidase TldD-related protein [Myxococcota bacterium]